MIIFQAFKFSFKWKPLKTERQIHNCNIININKHFIEIGEMLIENGEFVKNREDNSIYFPNRNISKHFHYRVPQGLGHKIFCKYSKMNGYINLNVKWIIIYKSEIDHLSRVIKNQCIIKSISLSFNEPSTAIHFLSNCCKQCPHLQIIVIKVFHKPNLSENVEINDIESELNALGKKVKILYKE